MYFQDSILAIQEKQMALWEDKYAHQKKYSDSCESFSKSAMLVVNSYKSDNEKLKKSCKRHLFWLRVFQGATAVSILTIILII